ncbi:MAG TPA: DUF892 family protein [Bryobacteraceae bacterium]|nr:DUF892 family protein [Bryobacteraceae bacterium]
MNFQTLMIKDLQDLYQAESEHARQLPELADQAASEELRSALEQHAEETQQQILRLQQILEMVGETPGGEGEVTPGVQGLVNEAQKRMTEVQEPMLRDLALIAAAQKMEHYEIACYGTARAMARSAGLEEAARLLQETLDEEEQADKRLTQIALPLLKQVAPEEVTQS